MRNLDRREFLGRTCQAAIGAAAANAFVSANESRAADSGASGEHKAPTIVAFTESFQDRPIPEVCRVFKEIGLDGLDLTVRPGGHIDPKDAPRELPKAAKAARDAGLEIAFLTSPVTDAGPEADEYLAAAAEAGVKRIKLGYYRYGDFGTLQRQLDEIRRRIEGVAKLAAKHGVLPCVHIHSGDTIPSHGTQLYELIRDFDPREVGAYVDPMHMTLEGGGGGWLQGLDLLAPWVAISSVKNFVFKESGRDDKGQLRWKVQKVPVADGMAPLPDFVARLKQIGFRGPYSLHSEYKGGGSFRDLSSEECVQQTVDDLKYFRTLL